jgi:hypothetical protein
MGNQIKIMCTTPHNAIYPVGRRLEPFVRGQNACAPASGDAESALQALNRLVRTIGELCARRLDRISRLNAQQQGDHGLGWHSAVVGKCIDVSILLFA